MTGFLVGLAVGLVVGAIIGGRFIGKHLMDDIAEWITRAENHTPGTFDAMQATIGSCFSMTGIWKKGSNR